MPIDTTAHVIFTDDHIERIRRGTAPAARLAWQILPYYFDFYQHRLNHWSCRVHEPAVTAALLDPSLVSASVSRSMIVESIADRHRVVGLTEADPEFPSLRPKATIVTAIDTNRFLDRLVDGLVLPLGTLPVREMV